jgi:hypothetical protein
MPFEEYLNVATQNVDWLIAIGIAVCLLLLVTFIVSLRRKVYRLQEELARLSDDVAALRLAEETRLFTELNPFSSDDAQEVRAARRAER